MNLRSSFQLLVIVLLVLTFAPNAPGETSLWIGPVGGEWTDTANWSTGAWPASTTTSAVIDSDATVSSTVQLSSAISLQDLTIDTGDSLELVNGGALKPAGVFSLDGSLYIDGNSSLQPSGPLLIGPDASVTLSPRASGQFSIATSAGSMPPFRHNLGLIQGAGLVETNRNLLNEGMILANTLDQSLVLRTDTAAQFSQDPPVLVNAGLLRSENGATLQVGPQDPRRSETLKNYLGQTPGVIEAGPNSIVSLLGVTVVGGLLHSDPDGGRIMATGIHDTTVQGTLHLAGKATGTTTNLGKIIALADMSHHLPSRLTGGGQLQLGDPQELPSGVVLRLVKGTSVTPLTNEDNRIFGRGTIDASGGVFINRGIVEAGFDSTGPSLGGNIAISLSNSPSAQVSAVNSGTLRANGENREIGISGNSFDRPLLQNYEGDQKGVIEAINKGRVFIDSKTTIRGGVIRSDATQIPSDAAPYADSVVQLGQSLMDPAVLESTRLEGAIGTLDSAAELWGSVENSGILIVRDLAIGADVQLSGGGEVYLPSGGKITKSEQLDYNVGGRLTNFDNTIWLGGVISGGSLGAELVNHGQVISTGVDSTSYLESSGVNNSGLLKAETGSTLYLGEVQTPLFSSNARVHAESGAEIRARAIQGGLITTDPSPDGVMPAGKVVVQGINGTSNLPSFADLRNEGQVELLYGAIAGTIENEGQITAVSRLGVGDSYAHLTGTGELILQGELEITQAGRTATLINGPQHTISGVGYIRADGDTIINHGAIVSTVSKLEIIAQSGAFLHDGALRGEEDGYFVVAADFTNHGRIVAASLGNRIHDVELVNAEGAAIELAGELTAYRIDNQSGATLGGSGQLLLDFQTEGPKSLVNRGLLAPSATPETLFIRGGFDQTSGGTLRVSVHGFQSDQHSVIEVNDVSGLAGRLEFAFDPQLSPTYGDEVRFIEGPTTGVFAEVFGLPTLESNLQWAIDYQPDYVAAVVSLAGDFNFDGKVDAADYATWRNGLGENYSQEDYTVWRSHFGAIAPAPTPDASTAAPSPAALSLLASLALLAVMRRR